MRNKQKMTFEDDITSATKNILTIIEKNESKR